MTVAVLSLLIKTKNYSVLSKFFLLPSTKTKIELNTLELKGKFWFDDFGSYEPCSQSLQSVLLAVL